MLFQNLVVYVALTLLTTVYASPIPAEQLNNRGIEISREVEVARDVAGHDWRRAAEPEAGPPGGPAGW